MKEAFKKASSYERSNKVRVALMAKLWEVLMLERFPPETMRFGQLLVNVGGDRLFQMEDEELIKELDKLVEKHK